MSKVKYTKEFKIGAINLVLEQGYTQTETAKSLSITPKLISRWIKEYTEQESQAFRGQGKLNSEQLEIRRLKEEVRRLTMEKDILKKASAFFAKEMK